MSNMGRCALVFDFPAFNVNGMQCQGFVVALKAFAFFKQRGLQKFLVVSVRTCWVSLFTKCIYRLKMC